MKTKILVFIVLVFSHLIPSSMLAQPVNKGVCEPMQITTPKPEKIKFWLLNPTACKHILESNAHREVTSKDLTRDAFPTYRFTDGSILYKHFINGWGHYFENLESFRRCYDPDAYTCFAIRYTKDQRLKHYYYEFTLPGQQALLARETLSDSTALDFKETKAYRISNGHYLHLQKPGLVHGQWFFSKEMFDAFIVDYYDTTEYNPSVRVIKTLYLDGYGTADVLRLSKDEAGKHYRNIEEKVEELKRMLRQESRRFVPFRTDDGKHMVAVDENVWLLSETELPLLQYSELEAKAIPNSAVTFLGDEANARGLIANTLGGVQEIHRLLPTIDTARLDYSHESLAYLEETVNGFFMGNYLQGHLELPLSIYVGEVFRRLNSGSWEISKSNNSWMPVVVVKGKNHGFLIDMIEQLKEQEYSYKSILAFF